MPQAISQPQRFLEECLCDVLAFEVVRTATGTRGGEAAPIALAIEHQAFLTLLDECFTVRPSENDPEIFRSDALSLRRQHTMPVLRASLLKGSVDLGDDPNFAPKVTQLQGMHRITFSDPLLVNPPNLDRMLGHAAPWVVALVPHFLKDDLSLREVIGVPVTGWQ